MAKSRKKLAEPLARMCESDESKVVRELMSKLGEKWSILVLVMLARAPDKRARFSELQLMVTGISQRMLTTTLRLLERDGFVERHVFPEVPPRVEYEVTGLGESLLVPMEQLAQWIGAHRSSIETARRRFEAGRSG